MLDPVDAQSGGAVTPSRKGLAFEFISLGQVAILSLIYILWSLVILFITVFGPRGYVRQIEPFQATNYTVSPHPYHFDFTDLQPLNGFLALDLTLNSEGEPTPSNISITIQTRLQFSDHFDVLSDSFTSDLLFNDGLSNRIRLLTIDRITFPALHSNVNLSFPTSHDQSGAFVFSYLKPSYTITSILLRAVFLAVGILTLFRLIPLPPYARQLAGRTLLALTFSLILATDLLFLLPFFFAASAFRYIDAVLTMFLVCAAAAATFFQLSNYVAPSQRIPMQDIAIHSAIFVIGFIAWTVAAMISLVRFHKEYLQQKDDTSWIFVLVLGVADIAGCATRLIKLRGVTANGILVMVVMTVLMPIVLIGSRMAVFWKEDIAWNLQLFDFLAAAGLVVFFGLVCGPVASEAAEAGREDAKSMSGFTPVPE
jgi:hypothetical protein